MCQSIANGGRRCHGKGSHVPVRALEQSLLGDNGLSAPRTPSEALHLVTLAAKGHVLDENIKSAARKFDIGALSPQQQWETWKSLALTKSPSKGLRALHEMGWEKNYPELHGIRNVPQDAHWHPEGSVEKHSQEAADVAARIARQQNLSEEDTRVAVLGALCHDFGKSTHTQIDPETGKITSHGHAQAGKPLAASFLKRVGAPKAMAKQISAIVAEHMCHVSGVNPRTALRLDQRLRAAGTTLEAWTRVADSDIGGRGSASEPSLAKEWLDARDEGERMFTPKARPFITGDHLREMGYKPGEHYQQMLKDSNEAHAKGVFKDRAGARKWIEQHFPRV